jgi:hypothetical protein
MSSSIVGPFLVGFGSSSMDDNLDDELDDDSMAGVAFPFPFTSSCSSLTFLSRSNFSWSSFSFDVPSLAFLHLLGCSSF